LFLVKTIIGGLQLKTRHLSEKMERRFGELATVAHMGVLGKGCKRNVGYEDIFYIKLTFHFTPNTTDEPML